MRYSVSGSTATAMICSSFGGEYLLGADHATGKVFWLRSAWFYNSASEDTVFIMDATLAAATHTAASLAKVKMAVLCASGRTTMVDIPAPGIKFSTSCIANMDASTAATTSGIQLGMAGGNGYEE